MSQAYKLHEAVDAEDDAWEKIAREPGAAMNLPILDLSGARDRSELKYLRLVNVGLALVPEDIPDLLAGVACTNVGAVLPVPTGTKVETRIGQTERSPVPPTMPTIVWPLGAMVPVIVLPRAVLAGGLDTRQAVS